MGALHFCLYGKSVSPLPFQTFPYAPESVIHAPDNNHIRISYTCLWAWNGTCHTDGLTASLPEFPKRFAPEACLPFLRKFQNTLHTVVHPWITKFQLHRSSLLFSNAFANTSSQRLSFDFTNTKLSSLPFQRIEKGRSLCSPLWFRPHR